MEEVFGVLHRDTERGARGRKEGGVAGRDTEKGHATYREKYRTEKQDQGWIKREKGWRRVKEMNTHLI